jgi:molybdopterin-guanine dinucleotide biosynthesis protein A
MFARATNFRIPCAFGTLCCCRGGFDPLSAILTDTVAVILGGGAGSRVGGKKPWIILRNRPLITYVADAVSHEAIRLAVVGDGGAAQLLNASVLNDDVGAGTGPLAGICAGLEWARSIPDVRWMMLAPCDTPALPRNITRRLREAATSDAAAVVAETSDGPQPLVSLWNTSLARSVRQAVLEGRHKVQDALDAAGCVSVHFARADQFLNVNTPDDLKTADRLLAAEE